MDFLQLNKVTVELLKNTSEKFDEVERRIFLFITDSVGILLFHSLRRI